MAHGLIAANAILQRQLKHINQLEEKIREDEPKVALATAITHSKDCIRIRELAKILKRNGVDTGQNKLFADLRRNVNIPLRRSRLSGKMETTCPDRRKPL